MLVVASAQADVSYYYDDLGRLVEAADPVSSKATVYSYDSAGNMTSVVNSAFSAVSISALQPASGNVNSTVVIAGTGFSTTAANNDVEFSGGVRGTVLTSPAPTATQLSVTVPSGAKTGAVTVKVGSTVATSPGIFTVTSGTGAPTITSFTPTQGAANTSVQITGTHFQTVAGNNKVAFNYGYAQVTSATATLLNVTVPASATSGPIQVSTPSGAATSSQIFVVPPIFPPSTNLPALPITGTPATLSTSQSVSAENYSSGSYSLMVFNGSAGQYLALSMSSLSGSGCTVTVAAPNGLPLAIKGSNGAPVYQIALSANGQAVQLPVLPMSGSYSVLVTSSGTQSGSATFSLYGPAGGAMTAGTPLTVPLKVPGQRVLTTFTGTANSYAQLMVSNDSIANAQLSLIGPDGSVLLTRMVAANAGAAATFQPSLPYSGQYTVLIDPAGALSGAATLQYAVISPSLIAGTPKQVSFTLQQTNATLTFADTAGDFPSIALFAAGSLAGTATLTAPDGSVIVSSFNMPTGFSVMNPLSPSPLLLSGVYTLKLAVTQGAPNSATVTLANQAVAQLTLNAGDNKPATSINSQWLDAQFSGTAGKYVAINVKPTNASYTTNYVLLAPDGTPITAGTASASGTVVNAMPSTQSPSSLQESGVYELLVQQLNTAGAVTFTASSAQNDPPSTLTIDGQTSSAKTFYAGQWMQLIFSNPATKSLSLKVIGSGTSPGATAWVLDPNGNVVATTTFAAHASATLALPSLPGNTLPYTVLAQPVGQSSGQLTFQLVSSP